MPGPGKTGGTFISIRFPGKTGRWRGDEGAGRLAVTGKIGTSSASMRVSTRAEGWR
jgi:hypothetical protein